MFADIVGFTALSARIGPAELIDMLNRLFSAFDELVDRHGLEKIKTIGDAYMVAGGLPEPRPGHLEAMATFALDMSKAMQSLPAAQRDLQIRIGIHVGSVVAGVIGRRKFSYDVWGDTVNTASRLESHGEPGRIQVSEAVYLRLRDRFAFGPCHTVELKGKGPVSAYFLEGLLARGDQVLGLAAGPRECPPIKSSGLLISLWIAKPHTRADQCGTSLETNRGSVGSFDLQISSLDQAIGTRLPRYARTNRVQVVELGYPDGRSIAA